MAEKQGGRRPPTGVSIGAQLRVPLRPWQQAALDEWSANSRRGIVEAATGTGKTMVAMGAIAALDSPKLHVAVVVPRVALAKQWRYELTAKLGIMPSDIGQIGDGHHANALRRVVVVVINSAREQLPPLVARWKSQRRKVLLIVDECHSAGSPANSRIFDAEYDAALGLSATPDRNDDGLARHLVPGIGDVVFEYPLLRALDDGTLAPLRLIDLYIDLKPAEIIRFQELSEKIDGLRARVESAYPRLQLALERWLSVLQQIARTDKDAERLLGLIFTRRRLVSDARARQQCIDEIAASEDLRCRRTLFFHETIESAERTAGVLQQAGWSVAMDHSELDKNVRERAQAKFRDGAVRALVVVRTADEGIDVPDANTAIIVSGTLTPRQRIQRIGRVLRPSGGVAICISLLARGTSEEHEVGGADADLVGSQRVSHHHWPETHVEAALLANASTYGPTADRLYEPSLETRQARFASRTRGSSCDRCGGPVVDSPPYHWCPVCKTVDEDRVI